ncbi:hypothetical protein BDY19DRAFT_440511 [Irpex rosettiformis]|uniref:Uncharacterized protein n=1 Tax=Irpex rosettiformis TaxID=378272 RepID=A0ACB8TU44_9APHY|nr:hypothetical protein BDY19DRAFT_440511 [Irpex rosettiformis]
MVGGILIAATAEEHVRWATIIKEVHICDGDNYIAYQHPATAHTTAVPAVALTKTPFYRLFSVSTMDRCYTTNVAERDACMENGYSLEPTAAMILACPSPEGDSVPLFRLYIDGKDHFYTTSAVEKELVVRRGESTFDEGIAGYVYICPKDGTIPLYRMYHPVIRDHCYTANAAERKNCIGSGWKDEGIACYVYPSA